MPHSFRSRDLAVYVVLDAPFLAGRTPAEAAQAAIDGGATFLQWRDKAGTTPIGSVAAAREVARRARVPFVVNDTIELARVVDADGAHVGQGDASVQAVREALGAGAIVGLSASTAAELEASDFTGVDYLGFGPVFPTATKADAAPASGLEALKEAVALSPVPVVGIGGITESNAAEVVEAGAAGAAVVTAVLSAPEPAEAASALSSTVRRARALGGLAPPNVLSIAGSDPSGGAGIQADLKAISANGGYAMAVLTALTAQNTCGVRGVHAVPPAFVTEQLEAVFADVHVDAIKVGMVGGSDTIRVVAAALRQSGVRHIVVDPVMIAKGGHALLADEDVAVVREELVPIAYVLTPNLPEAAALLGAETPTTREAMEPIAEGLLELGPTYVLLKGGHLEGAESPDLLVGPGVKQWFESVRVETSNTHGTGCTLSSTLATQLALQPDVASAVVQAKAYIEGAIAAADSLDVGQGHGPVQHFWRGLGREEGGV